jgi:hypothetical protein
VLELVPYDTQVANYNSLFKVPLRSGKQLLLGQVFVCFLPLFSKFFSIDRKHLVKEMFFEPEVLVDAPPLPFKFSEVLLTNFNGWEISQCACAYDSIRSWKLLTRFANYEAGRSSLEQFPQFSASILMADSAFLAYNSNISLSPCFVSR